MNFRKFYNEDEMIDVIKNKINEEETPEKVYFLCEKEER